MDLYSMIVGGIVRHLLSAIFLGLAAHGYYTNEQAGQIIAGLTGVVIMGCWSVWQKLATSEAMNHLIDAAENRMSATFRGTPTLVLLPLLLVAGFSASSCASAQATAVHGAVVGDTAIVQALHLVRTTEASAYASHTYAQAKHDAYLQAIVGVDRDALALTDAVDAWRAAGATPQSIPAIVATSKAALQRILADLSSLPASHPLVVALNAAIGFLS